MDRSSDAKSEKYDNGESEDASPKIEILQTTPGNVFNISSPKSSDEKAIETSGNDDVLSENAYLEKCGIDEERESACTDILNLLVESVINGTRRYDENIISALLSNSVEDPKLELCIQNDNGDGGCHTGDEIKIPLECSVPQADCKQGVAERNADVEIIKEQIKKRSIVLNESKAGRVELGKVGPVDLKRKAEAQGQGQGRAGPARPRPTATVTRAATATSPPAKKCKTVAAPVTVEPSCSAPSPKPKTREFVEFVSTDPKENEDNFNPLWEAQRILASDEERYKDIRRRWRNLNIPNPDVDLTYRHQRGPVQAAPMPPPPPPAAPRRPQGRHQRSYSCTTLYESAINTLEEEHKKTVKDLVDRHQLEVHLLQELQSAEQQQIQLTLWNPYLRRAALSAVCRRQQQDLTQLQSSLEDTMRGVQRRHEKALREYGNYISEVRTFNTFYQGMNGKTENNLLMSEEQFNNLTETERMYQEYKRVYGRKQ